MSAAVAAILRVIDLAPDGADPIAWGLDPTSPIPDDVRAAFTAATWDDHLEAQAALHLEVLRVETLREIGERLLELHRAHPCAATPGELAAVVPEAAELLNRWAILSEGGAA